VWVSVLLPIQKDESIDFSLLREEVDILIETGINGIYTNGTAGEFYNQTEEEFDLITEIVAERCERAGVPFQIGASALHPIVSLRRLRRAKYVSPGAIQVVLPDWVPLTRDEIIVFLKRMAEEADPIGLVLYLPPWAKTPLFSPEDLARLCQEVPSLIGIKVGRVDPGWLQAAAQQAPGLAIFVSGLMLATGLRLGARGSYSVVATLNPWAAKAWYDQMLVDIDHATELEQRIQQFWQKNIEPLRTQGYAAHAIDKLLVAVGGWMPLSTRMRWPYRSIPQNEAERLRPIAREMLPEFFSKRATVDREGR